MFSSALSGVAPPPHSFQESGRSLLQVHVKGRRVKPSSYGVVQELATGVDHTFYAPLRASCSDPRYRTLLGLPGWVGEHVGLGHLNERAADEETPTARGRPPWTGNPSHQRS